MATPARSRLIKPGATEAVVAAHPTLPRRNGGAPSEQAMEDLLRALTAVRDGDFSVRLSERRAGVMGRV